MESAAATQESISRGAGARHFEIVLVVLIAARVVTIAVAGEQHGTKEPTEPDATSVVVRFRCDRAAFHSPWIFVAAANPV